jgi:hypothetical protein
MGFEESKDFGYELLQLVRILFLGRLLVQRLKPLFIVAIHDFSSTDAHAP